MKKYDEIKKASLLGIIGNLFLLIIKLTTSLITKSQAMLADSINSAGDIISSLMTYIGNKIANKPKDEDHNLGHGKAEYIYSLLISIVMILVSLSLLKDSINILITKQTYDFSIWLIIVCIITIITKLSLYIYTKKLSIKYDNLLIKANSKDHLNDCVITIINLISCILAMFNIFLFDGIVGIMIAIWIMKVSSEIFLESYNVLMDKSMNIETKNKVLDIVKNYEQIKKINHFNSTPVGYKYQISLTIFVDGNMSTYESHEIANNLEKEIIKNIEEVYLAVIHVNPIEKSKSKK